MKDTQEELNRIRLEIAREVFGDLSERIWKSINRPWLVDGTEESKREQDLRVRRAG